MHRSIEAALNRSKVDDDRRHGDGSTDSEDDSDDDEASFFDAVGDQQQQNHTLPTHKNTEEEEEEEEGQVFEGKEEALARMPAHSVLLDILLMLVANCYHMFLDIATGCKLLLTIPTVANGIDRVANAATTFEAASRAGALDDGTFYGLYNTIAAVEWEISVAVSLMAACEQF